MQDATLVQLPERIAALPEPMHTLCNRLFLVERVYGHTVPPPQMYPWIEQHFGELEQVRRQVIIKTTNLFTLESASFNPLRGRRPQEDKESKANQDEALEELIASYAGAQDTFDQPWEGTTADVFGRIEGRHCVSASNVAKYDGWHGLVIFEEFHPLRFTRNQFSDYFDVALRWLLQAHEQDPQARYPLITWNCLWKSGASITHGHIQMALSREMASGRVEHWRRACSSYRALHQRSFVEDIWLVHQALGLDFLDTSEVRGYTHLTPLKDYEVVLESNPIAPFAQVQHASEEHDILVHTASLREELLPLWDACYATLRNLIDEQGVRSFNLVVYFPPFAATAEHWDDHRVRVRVVDRGHPLTRLVSIGAMEMFVNSIVTVDPFAVAERLRQQVK